MPVPFILMAAKIGAAIRAARPVLAEWNQLDPEAKKRVQSEADDVRRSLLVAGRSLGARLRDSKDKGISWEQGRTLALNPSREFTVARRLVDLVVQATQIDDASLQTAFAETDATAVDAALRIAETDGFIARPRPGWWRVTEFGDRTLAESDDILFMEQAIDDHIQSVGLAGRDELAMAVGSPDSNAPEFLAAVERALVAHTIAWLGPGMYGLPADQLAAMPPPAPTHAGTVKDNTELKPLLTDLKREIDELRHAVRKARTGELAVAAASSPKVGAQRSAIAPPASEDLYAKLRNLKDLFEEGVIDEAGFKTKKAELLGAI